ncbi:MULTISPECIES: YbaN family protein [Kordiimonas]|uniref:YbaN family protein n=1 Tax=Kordiimonas TaxID=288021 RepID=UPI001FF6C840|nr:YbaN family protein [Kordiimonas sp. SCSIO 12603]MCK0068123.1 YbaN family protein [Kordiimonas laminariae]UTW59906.1 YbaN family protein [Kordiimonas sp. SCSIO 12603]
MRYIWMACGWIAFVLGVIGAFLPLLPTVPFLLLAAFCFSRGSDKLHNWLLNHEKFGPPIAEWRKHGAIATRVKFMAMGFILFSIGLSFLYDVPTRGFIIQIVVLSCVSLFILTRPAPPKEATEEGE